MNNRQISTALIATEIGSRLVTRENPAHDHRHMKQGLCQMNPRNVDSRNEGNTDDWQQSISTRYNQNPYDFLLRLVTSDET